MAAPVFLAVDSGEMKKQGVDMKIVVFRGGPPSITALLTNKVQFMSVAVDEFLKVAGKGKVVRVYDFSHSNTLNLQMGNSFLNGRKVDVSLPVRDRIRQLKGATLGTVTLGGATDIYARWMFKYAGLDPRKDVRIIRIGGLPAMLAAVGAKKIDGFLLSPPAGQLMEAKKLGRIVVAHTELEPFREHEYFGVSVTPAYLAKNRDLVRRVIAAVKKAQAFAHRAPKEAAKVLHEGSFKHVSLRLVEAAMVQMQNAFRPGLMSAQNWSATTDLMRDAGFKKVENITLKEGVDWTNELAR
jgi:NitT/TauT family transport system substrate-binding protein